MRRCELARVRRDLLDLAAGTLEIDVTRMVVDGKVIELAQATLLPDSPTSWYMGNNIPGKPRRVLVYLGGAPAYRAKCDEVAGSNYEGFDLSASRTLAAAA